MSWKFILTVFAYIEKPITKASMKHAKIKCGFLNSNEIFKYNYFVIQIKSNCHKM
jgi:hypothetical protein